MSILDSILEIGKKLLPDKDKQLEFEVEMRKLDLDEFKEKKGIIKRALHLVFPMCVVVLLFMYIGEFFLKVHYFLKTDVWLLQDFVPHGLQLIALIFLSLLMPKKILEPLIEVIIKYISNKFK